MRRNRVLVLISTTVCLALASLSDAAAQCPALPNQLTNGQVADASQVMANFNALVGCVNNTVNAGTAGQVGFYATNGKTISGESLSTLLDAAIGSTRGSILERGANGWVIIPPGTSGTVLTSNGSGADPSYTSAGSGSRGLFSGQMSNLVPSQSSTGFSTWLHQGSTTETDTPLGMNFTGGGSGGGGHFLSGLVQAAPAAPYTRTILVIPSGHIALPSFSWIVFGWYDGSAKLQTITYYGQGVVQQNNFTTTTSFTSGNNFSTVNGSWIWLQIQDDGTNFFLRHSFDGVKFNTDATGPKSSGFLGPSGYANIFLGLDDYAAYAWTVASYQ